VDIILNGIDPITGDSLALSLETAVEAAFNSQTPSPVQSLRDLPSNTRGLPFGVDRSNIAQAGWGLVFHAEEDPAVPDALGPLLQHRVEQAGNEKRTKALTYSGEPFETWLAQLGVAPGTVRPDKLPYYLLVIGDPERIPFEFTQLLSLEYAVGRLHLDSPGDYRRYAQAVIDYETQSGPSNTKEVIFFATKHTGDAATNLSCEQLAKPLLLGSDGDAAIPDTLQFQSTALLADDATKGALLAVLSRPAEQHPPAVLFSATHGLGWPIDDPLQITSQGALLCGDWKGRGLSPVPITAPNFLNAADLSAANVKNLIAFVFACFGLATPVQDRYSFQPPQAPKQLARKPFFSPLAKALLSAPSGPALAMFGHVDRAFASSIQPPGAGPQIQPFQNALGMILSGAPLGLALSGFEERYGTFSAMLDSMLADKVQQTPVDNQQFVNTWIQQHDASAFVLFGDPAVRLRPERLTAQ